MPRLVILIFCMLIGACAHKPAPDAYLPHAFDPKPISETRKNHAKTDSTKTDDSTREPVSQKPGFDMMQLIQDLGLHREAHDLGFAEKPFDGCRRGVKGEDGKCGSRFLGLLHFRLVCREDEGTTENIVSTNVTPLFSDNVKWKLAGLEGLTKTDGEGYGQVQVIGTKPARGQRLVLIVGKQFLGLDISEVRQIVVPNYWCNQKQARNGVLSKAGQKLLATSVLSKSIGRQLCFVGPVTR